MSSSRVKHIKQFYQINSYKFDSANGLVTVTANGHNLFSNVKVILTSDINYDGVKGVANVTSSNTFTVSTITDPQFLTHYVVYGYLPGQTGAQVEQTLPRATGTDTIIQSYVNGTGGASYYIDVSLDSSNWIRANSITHGSDSGNTTYVTIKPGWAYYRANVASVGANTNLVIMSGE